MAGIRQSAEKALRAARRRQGEMGAVNWGDLSVRAVVFCKNEEAQEWYRVDIEEASPDCALTEFVYDRLAKDGFPKTEVNVEW